MDTKTLLEIDQQHVWHPYNAMNSGLPVFAVESANGVRLKLASGEEIIDGMSSWWCAVHGYNNSILNNAVETQIKAMSHVMFGGLTHQPAVALAKKLVDITPDALQAVFFADTGSVSVEVAMKMAIQYWHAKGRTEKQRFISLRSGYHGDTFGAMSVCDPDTGMHSLFSQVLPQQHFVDSPACKFGDSCSDSDIAPLKNTLEKHHQDTAALIMEPIVQGAGGMHFYSEEYLIKAQELCDHYGVLLILDEIATGFGRSGKLFACEHANICPDIMTMGKSLTGGYLSLAATLTTTEVAQTISSGEPGVFMHGPTFMANPLACAVGLASVNLLLDSPWQKRVENISTVLKKCLNPCLQLQQVADVRVLGAIGVVETVRPVDMSVLPKAFVDAGVWVRPFGKLIYLMPPFIIEDQDLQTLCEAVYNVISEHVE